MGKSYIENSLKRFLKRKVKITLGLVVTFMITGAVALGIEGPFVAHDGENCQIKELKDKNIIINGGLIGQKYGTVSNYQQAGATGSVLALNGGTINLGSKETEKIILISKGDYAQTLATDNFKEQDTIKKGGKITVTADEVNIEAHGTNGYSHAVYSITRSSDYSQEDVSQIVINSKNTTIISTMEDGISNGVTAWSQGQVKINNGNVHIIADNVINTRGNSLVEINANNNSQNTVNLNGDIVFTYNGVSSGTPIESDIKINLSNSDSKFTGSIHKVIVKKFPDGKTEEQKKELLSVSSMKLGLSNGATWEVTGDSFVNTLNLNNGIINIKKSTEEIKQENVLDEDLQTKDGKTTLNVDNLKGNGGTVTFESKIEGKEIEVAKANLRIRESTAKGTNLKVGLSGVNTDDLAQNNISAEKALGELTDKVVNKDNKRPTDIKQTLFVEGGALTGEATAELDANGKLVNIRQEKETPITASVRDLAVINYLSWKQEMGSLTQRMGELRDSSAEHGVWSRVYGGKVENGSQYDNKYQTYQVGYDKKYSVDNGRVYLGYLVSYTDGETDYTLGHGENYSVGAGIYATWMNNNGHYADVLYKVSRLNNKFTVNDVEKFEGDYDNFGISLSAEYGKRFDLGEKWFAEPNVGMHLGQLSSETYTTNTGIEVSQDSIYTAEGRVGAAIGYKFSDKGNVYARTHVVKEFAGDVDTEFERNGVHAKVSEDMGDTWFEFGVGANYRFTESMNVYADIEKTGDSTVDTKWQANLGFRYEF